MPAPVQFAIEPGSVLTAVGHSHCACLHDAQADGVRFRLLSFWFIPDALDTSGGEQRLGAELVRQIRETPEGMPILDFMGGGAHAVLSMAAHPQPFDFVLPDAPDLPLDPDAEILPYDAVRQRLEADAREFLDLTEQLIAVGRGPVFHVDTPPPVADGDFIAQHIPWQYFPGRKQEVSPKWHRYRMWRLNTDIARAHARSVGAGFISHPVEAEDGEGFLDRRYSGDGAHGDATYGNMLAARILSVLRDGRLRPGDLAPDMAKQRMAHARAAAGQAA